MALPVPVCASAGAVIWAGMSWRVLGNLRDHRPELGIEQRADVERSRGEQLEHLPADRVGVDEADLLDAAELDHLDDLLREDAPQDVVTLAADTEDLDLLALAHQAKGMIAGKARDR